VQVEACFNEFLQLEESALFRDTEVVEHGNIDDWATANVGAPPSALHLIHCATAVCHASDHDTRPSLLWSGIYASIDSEKEVAGPTMRWTLAWLPSIWLSHMSEVHPADDQAPSTPAARAQAKRAKAKAPGSDLGVASGKLVKVATKSKKVKGGAIKSKSKKRK
jgi:hypothetical protein